MLYLVRLVYSNQIRHVFFFLSGNGSDDSDDSDDENCGERSTSDFLDAILSRLQKSQTSYLNEVSSGSSIVLASSTESLNYPQNPPSYEEVMAMDAARLPSYANAVNSANPDNAGDNSEYVSEGRVDEPE